MMELLKLNKSYNHIIYTSHQFLAIYYSDWNTTTYSLSCFNKTTHLTNTSERITAGKILYS